MKSDILLIVLVAITTVVLLIIIYLLNKTAKTAQNIALYYFDLDFKTIFTFNNMGWGVPIYNSNDGWIVKSMVYDQKHFPILKLFLYEPLYDKNDYSTSKNYIWPQYITPYSFYFRTNDFMIHDIQKMLINMPIKSDHINIFNMAILPNVAMIQPITLEMANYEQSVLLKKCIHDRVIWGETPVEGYEYCLMQS
jgi:hypothetical protein